MAPGGRRGHSQARRRCQEASAGRRARGGLIGAGAATSILTAFAKADAMDRYAPSASSFPRAPDTH